MLCTGISMNLEWRAKMKEKQNDSGADGRALNALIGIEIFIRTCSSFLVWKIRLMEISIPTLSLRMKNEADLCHYTTVFPNFSFELNVLLSTQAFLVY
jgi:hypothetical protein